MFRLTWFFGLDDLLMIVAFGSGEKRCISLATYIFLAFHSVGLLGNGSISTMVQGLEGFLGVYHRWTCDIYSFMYIVPQNYHPVTNDSDSQE